MGTPSPASTEKPDAPPGRIVSLAPNITEIVFALGLGHRVVGVTRYCDEPPAATRITKVGGYTDPSYENIVALTPDITIILTSHGKVRQELNKLGIRTLTVPHETIQDIHEAIQIIGNACGASRQAEAMVADLERHQQSVAHAVTGRPCPSVLICIGRDMESGRLGSMYMAGRNGYYDEIITLAGGVNACSNENIAYPQLSPEGVIQQNPDVIIDLVSQKPGGKTLEEITRQWDRLPVVTAVQKGRVHVITGTYALRPGPRYVHFLKEMAVTLHPEAFPGKDHP